MTANFPSNPSNNQSYTFSNRTWVWDGSKWNASSYAAKSAYESAVDSGFIGTESEWVASLEPSLTKNIRTVSTSTTLLSSDENQIIRFTGTSAQTLTIPDVLSPGSSVTVIQDNSGLVSFASSGSVNLLSPTGEFYTIGQNSIINILCVDSNEYRLTGDLPDSFYATGGAITDIAGYRVHTFTSSGTFTVSSGSKNIEYLVIAGGGCGGGWGGGGGGAGGYRSSVIGEMSGGGASAESTFYVSEGSYVVTVGAGSPGSSNPHVNGSNSSFDSIISLGGGSGGGSSNMSTYTPNNPGDGGSGGGSSWIYQTQDGQGGIPTSGQGYSGGSVSFANADYHPTGGGGGAGSAGGSPANTFSASGNGGIGVQSNIDGNNYYYAGGGGGGIHQYAGGPQIAGNGGLGGGGGGAGGDTQGSGGGSARNAGQAGQGPSSPGGNGGANTGGGGGGGASGSGNAFGGNGGSGIVIVRYPI